MNLFKSLFSPKKSESEINRTKQLYEIDDKIRIQFFQNLYQASYDKVIELIENQKIDVNGYADYEHSRSILISVISDCNSEFKGSENHVKLVKYIIDKGADINVKTKEGHNALEIALSFHSMSNIALILIKTGKADIHSTEKHGNNLIFTAIREYSLTWREEQKTVNQIRFEIIKELLNHGVDLDIINNHGISARTWIEKIPENDKLHKLINEFEKK
ncbi:ankyrin repeat domain-containing protein [Robertkochia solimangrovi]|uniref:ankyrin repeat domain-containing protein n=1 Tax=Robertkochia solimangrovi TaxID=2213046 RepID=UPI00117E9406|nr:ankyrin repeat domain-containing protein [Robertkochia solimangrovi]TRZ42485.1 hypothetical protein DMZ48_13350 [Robertkochia solimangrovi]